MFKKLPTKSTPEAVLKLAKDLKRNSSSECRSTISPSPLSPHEVIQKHKMLLPHRHRIAITLWLKAKSQWTWKNLNLSWLALTRTTKRFSCHRKLNGHDLAVCTGDCNKDPNPKSIHQIGTHQCANNQVKCKQTTRVYGHTIYSNLKKPVHQQKLKPIWYIQWTSARQYGKEHFSLFCNVDDYTQWKETFSNSKC